MIAANRKSGILRKAQAFKVSKRTLCRYLKRVGETKGLEDIRKELESIGNDELLTFTEIAKILKCSYSSVNRITVQEGLVPYRLVLGTWLRVHASDLKTAILNSEYFSDRMSDET